MNFVYACYDDDDDDHDKAKVSERNTSTSVSNRKFVVAWSTYTTYIKYVLLFSRNLHGRFSFGTQLCFNGLSEIIESNHFCGGGGGGIRVVQRLKMDIRHDEETDVFQGAW